MSTQRPGPARTVPASDRTGAGLPLGRLGPPTPIPGAALAPVRPVGKFFRTADGAPFYVKGVTYGPFAPGPDGEPYDPARTRSDFAQMARAGINTVRLYTAPPPWLLDTAAEQGLQVLAGIAWEQHIAFLDDRRLSTEIRHRVGATIAARAGHPALLAWSIGNEIPAPIVRWHGPAAVRRFLAGLYGAAHDADPATAVTYVNYPTTEYLELDFLDFVCFNVFLETQAPFERYLQRLLNLAGDRPLLLTEIGLDSGTHGEAAQAETIDWQMRSAFAAGCAGACAFAWTDEWHRGGAEITDWHFGLTDRAREPKPALAALGRAYAEVPIALGPAPPRVSVLICTYNGSATLEETCTAVQALRYPDYEVVVVDDGSTDASAEIARAHGFRVISTPNRGLSSARNTALSAATGEIVVYLDDDAMPDPHWLHYLADAFARHDFVGIGGPNLPVPGDGIVADAVAASPGNPVHVLLDDREAEHIPGCNCAFRAEALRAVGGFDVRFTSAGDDVDICWRLQDAGGRLGYAPAAVVWHHRRRSVAAYLRQQRGYGRAEALLERKWPERYSAGGHVTWRGRVYGDAAPRHPTGPMRWRVYHGVWGTALFQSLYEPARGDLNAIALMPETYLGIGLLALLTALGALWTPLLALAPLLVVLAGALAVRAAGAAVSARFPSAGLTPSTTLRRRCLVALLCVLQPLVRLDGRLRSGLTPWRRFGPRRAGWPRTRSLARWSETWREQTGWIAELEAQITADGAVVRRGGEFDPWDIETRGGILAGVRVTTTLEEHGSGRQLIRARCRPRYSGAGLTICATLLIIAALAAVAGAVVVAIILLAAGLALGSRIASEASSALALTGHAIDMIGVPA